MNRAEFQTFFGADLDENGRFLNKETATNRMKEYIVALLKGHPDDPERRDYSAHELEHAARRGSSASDLIISTQGRILQGTLCPTRWSAYVWSALNATGTNVTTQFSSIKKREFFPMNDLLYHISKNLVAANEMLCPRGFVSLVAGRWLVCSNQKCRSRMIWLAMNCARMRSIILDRVSREKSGLYVFDPFLSLVELKERYDTLEDLGCIKVSPSTPVSSNDARPVAPDAPIPVEKYAPRHRARRAIVLDNISDDEEPATELQRSETPRASPVVSPLRSEDDEAACEPKNIWPSQVDVTDALSTLTSLAKSDRIFLSPPSTPDRAHTSVSIFEKTQAKTPPRVLSPPPIRRPLRPKKSQPSKQTQPIEVSSSPPRRSLSKPKKSNSQPEREKTEASRKRKAEPEPEEAKKRRNEPEPKEAERRFGADILNLFTTDCDVERRRDGTAFIRTALLTTSVKVESISLAVKSTNNQTVTGLSIGYFCPYDSPAVRRNSWAFVHHDITKVYGLKMELEKQLFDGK